MKTRYVPCIIAAIFVFAISAWAQDETPQNATAWYGYEGYHPFEEGKPWGLMLEGYVKRNKIVTRPQGLFFRAGLNYELKSGHRITGGYAYQYNNPYDSRLSPTAGRTIASGNSFCGDAPLERTSILSSCSGFE